MAYTKHLDKSRSYGTHYPPYEGAYYQQDGFHFDNDGNVVEALLSPDQKKLLDERAAKSAAAKAAGQQPEADKPPAPEPEPETAGADEEEVNLADWLKDDKAYSFMLIRDIVKARYSVWKTSKAAVVNFLVNEHKLVLPEDLDPDLRKLYAAGDE